MTTQTVAVAAGNTTSAPPAAAAAVAGTTPTPTPTTTPGGVGGITTTPEQPAKKNRIQVSNTKKPLFFYVNLAKKYIQQHNEVELSALGMAITTVVTIAEILKNNGFATEKKVLTSTVGMKDEAKGRLVQKARIEIVLGKTEKFDSLMSGNNSGAQEANKNNKQNESKQEENKQASESKQQ